MKKFWVFLRGHFYAALCTVMKRRTTTTLMMCACVVQKQDESLAERTTTQTSADETVETEKAAVRIQAASRGYLARCRLKHTR